jgi:hypothetical protein
MGNSDTHTQAGSSGPLGHTNNRAARHVALLLGARLAEPQDDGFMAHLGAWLDGLNAAHLETDAIEPRVSAHGEGLSFVAWRDGPPSDAMIEWIAADLPEPEAERLFGLAARLQQSRRPILRWAGVTGTMNASKQMGYTLAGHLDLDLASLLLGREATRSETVVALVQAAQSDDLIEVTRREGATELVVTIDPDRSPLVAWRELVATPVPIDVERPLMTLIERRSGPVALSVLIGDDDTCLGTSIRVPIGDSTALAAGLTAAGVPGSKDSRLAKLTAAFECERPSWIELRQSARGRDLWCGFGHAGSQPDRRSI